jgi:hypothetical protein
MSYRFYNFIGTPGRVFFEGDDPEYCEIYNGRMHGFVRQNDLMLDMLSHHQSLEISLAEFDGLMSGFQDRSDQVK